MGRAKISKAQSSFHSLVRKTRLDTARKLGTHTNEEWLALCEEFEYRCVICWTKPDVITKDHITPLFYEDKLSDDTIYNIQPVCKPCNSSKSYWNTNWKETRRMRKIFPHYMNQEELYYQEILRKHVAGAEALDLAREYKMAKSTMQNLLRKIKKLKIGT